MAMTAPLTHDIGFYLQNDPRIAGVIEDYFDAIRAKLVELDAGGGGGMTVGGAITGATAERFLLSGVAGVLANSDHARFIAATNQIVFGNGNPQSGYKETIWSDAGDLGLMIRSANTVSAAAVAAWMNNAAIYTQAFQEGPTPGTTRLNGLSNNNLFRLFQVGGNGMLLGAEDAPNYMPLAAAEYFTPGGRIKQFLANVATGANTTETDANSWTTPANTLTRNGDTLIRDEVFFLGANANTKRLRVYFGATTIYDSTATQHNGGAVRLRSYVQRTGAATQRCWVEVLSSGSGTPVDDGCSVPVSAAETLSGAVVFRATMTNGTANAADITCATTSIYADLAGH